MEKESYFGTEKVWKILLRLAPPIMLAQLIQALYNIIDSLFVGRYSDSGLTALSIIYPLQLLMIAIAVGTGVGINTAMSAKLGVGEKEEAERFAGIAAPLAIALYAVFALLAWFLMPYYARISTSSPEVIEDVVSYGRLTSVFSFGLFLESVWTKVLQARGDMKTPMFAQIAGALVNIALDPILIFGWWIFPEMGIEGAAVATVAGQMVAALVVVWKGFRKPPSLRLFPRLAGTIFRLGLPNILMQSAYTFYIFGLNLILSGFGDAAVTALGLYYKWQTFFFIPLGAMQTCIVPIISYNYAARNLLRCRKTLADSIYFGLAFMAVGLIVFMAIPDLMLQAFTSDPEVIEIGTLGFRIVSLSFLPLVTSLIFPVYFQAIGYSFKSSALTLLRTLVLFVPLGYLFSRLGLSYFWIAYPVTEVITSLVGFLFYRQFLRSDYMKGEGEPLEAEAPSDLTSSPGLVVCLSREHGSSGKEIGRRAAEMLGIPFYYKEMIALAAEESGLDPRFLSDIHRNSPTLLRELYFSSRPVQYAMKAQGKIIRKIAEHGSCLIVGRGADVVLKDRKNLVRVFVKAPLEIRITRIMEKYGDGYKEAKKNIRHADRARGSYYRHMSGNKWGNPSHYDLVIDSSSGLEEAARELSDYVKARSEEALKGDGR